MGKPSSLPDEEVLGYFDDTKEWFTTNDIFVRAGLAGHELDSNWIGRRLRQMERVGLIESNGRGGRASLRWRKVSEMRRQIEEALLQELGTIEALLTIHQRRDAGACMCGWGELGKSFAQHQAEILTTGALLDELKERGYERMDEWGRALSDATRQLRATLPLDMIHAGRS